MDGPPPLPPGVAEDQLRDVVAASTSWRGVLRAFGLSSAHRRRQLRAWCAWAGVDTSHFRQRSWSDDALRASAPTAAGWDELLAALGLAPGSGTARASVRRRAGQLGIRLDRLDPVAPPGPLRVEPSMDRLREAGALLVAATCVMAGHKVSWPLEPAPYDLVVTSSCGPAQRVQVKTTTYRDGGSWMCAVGRGAYRPGGGKQRTAYEPHEIDVLGAVDADLRVYLIPSAELSGARVVSLRRFEGYRVRTPWGDLTR